MTEGFSEGVKMAKIPKNPEDVFSTITEDLKQIFGNDLLCLILYGSGASGHYIPGRSDINFLVILSEQGMNLLDRAVRLVSQWRKSNVAIPLFMTKDDILSSLDSYPVEFLNIKDNHVLVYGEDFLDTIPFEAGDIRLQCERELKGKIFHLRTGFLETEGTSKRIRELIKVSITAFISVFKALLYLKGIDIPQGRREVIKTVAEIYTIEPNVFLQCLDIKDGTDRTAASDIQGVFSSYLNEIGKLSKIVDRLDVK
jgi:hypothetical protein